MLLHISASGYVWLCKASIATWLSTVAYTLTPQCSSTSNTRRIELGPLFEFGPLILNPSHCLNLPTLLNSSQKVASGYWTRPTCFFRQITELVPLRQNPLLFHISRIWLQLITKQPMREINQKCQLNRVFLPVECTKHISFIVWSLITETSAWRMYIQTRALTIGGKCLIKRTKPSLWYETIFWFYVRTPHSWEQNLCCSKLFYKRFHTSVKFFTWLVKNDYSK